LPIFTDEAIYIRWSQIGSRDASWRFISLVDGKQPMFTWIMMVFHKVIADPLTAGRLVSVLAGFGSLVGIGFTAYELFKSKRIGVLSSFFYLISPFSLMYDRLAIYDSLVATFSIWSFYMAVRLVRRPRLDTALLFGMVLGAGMLNKTSGFLSLYLLPTTLLLFDWQAKNLRKRLVTWVLLGLVAAGVSQVMYGVLRLSPYFHMIALKNEVFVYPLKEWIEHPWRFLQGNLRGMFDWVVNYLTAPLFVLALVPGLMVKHKPQEKALLYIWWLVPFVGLALFAKILYPRFILFMTMPLLILMAYAVNAWFAKGNWRAAGIGLCLFLLPALYMDAYIVADPLHAPIPVSDRGQLIDDWPSGGGVKDVLDYVRQQAVNGKVTVYTEGTFGLLPYALEMYFVDIPNATVHGIWPLPDQIPEHIAKQAALEPTYLVVNQSQAPPSQWPLTFIFDRLKGTREDRKLRFYKVEPAR
jgi:hypothetical protein